MDSPRYFSLIIVLIVLFVVAWLTLYLMQRLFSVYRKQTIRRGYWLATAASVLLIALSRWLSGGIVLANFLNLSFIWLIGQMVMLLLLPLLYGTVGLTRRLSPAPSGDPGVTRRSFLRGLAAAVPISAFGFSGYGVLVGGSELKVQHVPLRFPHLPESLNDFKIVQISDTHLGLFFSLDRFDDVLAKVMAEKPQLLVITGDLIDDLSLLDQAIAKLTAIERHIPYGIYFCWGNHEYFRDIGKIRRAFSNSPIRLLENDSRLVIDGEYPFYLAGVDYPWAKNAAEQTDTRGRMFGQALRSIPQEAFTVLLSHHPDFIVNAFDAAIPLTLSGHTHGGQVALFGRSILPVKYRYMRGLYRQGNQYGYVSSGTGHWLPFRVGCPAEFTVFTLHRQ